MSFAQQRDGERPYQSIDLETSPHQTSEPEHDAEKMERMPLSPRAPAFQSMPLPQQQQAPGQPVYPPRPMFSQTSSLDRNPGTPNSQSGHKSNSSWDMLGGLSKEWNGFDSRNASQAAFQYAEGQSQSLSLVPLSTPPHNVIEINLFKPLLPGDAPQTKVCRGGERRVRQVKTLEMRTPLRTEGTIMWK